MVSGNKFEWNDLICECPPEHDEDIIIDCKPDVCERHNARKLARVLKNLICRCKGIKSTAQIINTSGESPDRTEEISFPGSLSSIDTSEFGSSSPSDEDDSSIEISMPDESNDTDSDDTSSSPSDSSEPKSLDSSSAGNNDHKIQKNIQLNKN